MILQIGLVKKKLMIGVNAIKATQQELQFLGAKSFVHIDDEDYLKLFFYLLS
jgi:hypothetical protein